MEERCYITFPALTQVLKAEKLLSALEVKFCVVPIPREISSDCGMCIMCFPDKLAVISKVLSANNIEHEEIFIIKKKKLNFFNS